MTQAQNPSPEPRDYKKTLHLPQTDFPMKANLAQREPGFLQRWSEEAIYQKILEKNQGKPKFVLHDGPPYANGNIHFGHILNKTLKDIIVKYHSMTGRYCEFIPGWDCHGLPIEHQVDKNLGAKKSEMSLVEIRQACRNYAADFVDVQRKDFQRLGIFATWDEPYLTMNYAYEANTARELAKLVRKGYVYKGSKPVHWCMQCQTALAEAEVEYDQHLSPSIYVKFFATEDWSAVSPALKNKKVAFVIWTTTPWTLPANLALALNRSYTYVAVQVGDEVLIVAEALLDGLRLTLNFQEDALLDRIPAKKLEGLKAQHPFLPRTSVVILSDHVTLDAGTGIVHIAPGHGQEDYEAGLRYQLPILNPVDHRGRFHEEVGVPELVGLPVLKANAKVLEILREKQALLKSEDLKHSYPHCWRCKSPVIFRSTPQYFVSMKHRDLRGKSLDAIRRTEWIPSWGRDRIYGMVENRPDWCISRQRSWGVPIMGFACVACRHSLLDADVIEHIAKRFETEGADAFFQYSESELLPPGTRCPQCQGTEFQKEKDILDVWFDSGVSFAAVLGHRDGLKFPADLYLEGSDQHRGWFHSSLLVAMGTAEQPPYETVLTHGFVVDAEGKKYSKSAKNYEAPEKMIQKTGAEILRLWVAAEDYRNDIRFSGEIVERLTETYRKIRNTCRFLLGNLFDFDVARHYVAPDRRSELDRWMLHQLQLFLEQAHRAYAAYEFHEIYQALNRLCTVTLSAFYLDILKDILYTAAADGEERRAAQSTIYDVLQAVTPAMAPILSFTAEEIYQYFPAHEDKQPSIFLTTIPSANEALKNSELFQTFETIVAVRAEVLKALEKARQEKVIGHPLEAQVRLYADAGLQKFLLRQQSHWATYLIVSQVVVAYDCPGSTWDAMVGQDFLKIQVLKAEGEKCERCWTRSLTVGKSPAHPTLCDRCVRVLS